MGMPIITPGNSTCEQAVTNLIESVAMQENALSVSYTHLCACGDKDIFPAVDKGEAGQAQAGFAGVAGFSAQDFTAGDGSAVQGLEHGADKGDAVRVDISRGGGIAACGEYLTEFLIAQGVCKKNGKILSSGVQPLFMQPGGIGKACIFHAKFLCLAVHQDCEGFLRAGYGVGKGQAAVSYTHLFLCLPSGLHSLHNFLRIKSAL